MAGQRVLHWIGLVIFLALLVWLARWGINNAYRKALQQATPFVASCGRVWAHRGHVGNTPPNSLKGVKAALKAGAPGIEIDIQYMPEENRFLLSHDDITPSGNPKNHLTLDKLLGQVKSHNDWWLDAKNLRKLWPWQADDAVNRLRSVLIKHHARDRAIVETSNPLYLRWVKQAGIGTQLAVKPNDREHPAAVFWVNVYLMKWFYSWGPFNAITMGYDRYTPKVQAAFGSAMPVNLSTFNASEQMAVFAAMDNVRILLISGKFFDCHAGQEAASESCCP